MSQVLLADSPFPTTAHGLNADGFEIPFAKVNNDINCFCVAEGESAGSCPLRNSRSMTKNSPAIPVACPDFLVGILVLY